MPQLETLGGSVITGQEIGTRIKARRLQRGLSQGALGELVGVSFQQIHKYEHGKSEITVAMLQAVCAALDVPVSYFLADDVTARQSELQMLAKPGALTLLTTFAAIKDYKARQLVLDLAEHFASE
jgi:transcriptional regulator with XRE-family HTH domain